MDERNVQQGSREATFKKKKKNADWDIGCLAQKRRWGKGNPFYGCKVDPILSIYSGKQGPPQTDVCTHNENHSRSDQASTVLPFQGEAKKCGEGDKRVPRKVQQ